MISYDPFTWTIEIFYYLCSILEVSVIIFFIFEYFKHKSDFKTSFYLILNIDYCISFIICLFWFLYDFFGDTLPTLGFITAFQEWYGLFFYGFCNFLLGLNRCSALAFPFNHKRVWSKYSNFLIPLILFFPFISNCYNFLDWNCKLYLFEDECFSFRVSIYFQAAILNIILNSLALFFVIYGIIKVRATKQAQSYKLITERKLVYQSVVCAVCQIIYYMFSAYAVRYPYDDQMYTVFYNIGFTFYVLQRYSNLIIIFVVHPAFRKKFWVFYGLFYVSRCKTFLFGAEINVASSGGRIGK